MDYQLIQEANTVGAQNFENKCQRKKLTHNCLVEETSQPSCVTCKPEFKRVKNTANEHYTCQKVLSENCKLYDSSVCTLCAQGYYLENSVCVRGDSIPNCHVHSSKVQCLKCVAGFTLNTDKNQCSVAGGVVDNSC